MGCGCKKKVPTNKEKLENDKKVRAAMKAFFKFKASGGWSKSKLGKS